MNEEEIIKALAMVLEHGYVVKLHSNQVAYDGYDENGHYWAIRDVLKKKNIYFPSSETAAKYFRENFG